MPETNGADPVDSRRSFREFTPGEARQTDSSGSGDSLLPKISRKNRGARSAAQERRSQCKPGPHFGTFRSFSVKSGDVGAALWEAARNTLLQNPPRSRHHRGNGQGVLPLKLCGRTRRRYPSRFTGLNYSLLGGGRCFNYPAWAISGPSARAFTPLRGPEMPAAHNQSLSTRSDIGLWPPAEAKRGLGKRAAARPTAASPDYGSKNHCQVADNKNNLKRPSHAAAISLSLIINKAILLRAIFSCSSSGSEVFVEMNARIFLEISSFTISVWHSKRLITSRRITSFLRKACSRGMVAIGRAPARGLFPRRPDRGGFCA